MTDGSLLIVGWFLFISGLAIGVQLPGAWRIIVREQEQKEHDDILIEQGKEIARLRAQVASIIGKEKGD